MSKAKKIISMFLVVALVMSAFPLGSSLFTSTATAAGATWSASDPTGISAVVDCTKVIRVAKQGGSFLNGTTIVSASKNGVPETSGTYSAIASAGLTYERPYVQITLGQEVDAGTLPVCTVQSNDSTKACNITMPIADKADSNTSYRWNIPCNSDEPSHTAVEGTTLIYTISYVIGGVNYTSYATSNVREIASYMGGSFARVRTELNGDFLGMEGSYYSRFGVIFAMQGEGLYGRIGYLNGAEGSNGWELGTGDNAGKTGRHALLNWNCSTVDAVVGDATSTLVPRGTSGVTHYSMWAANEVSHPNKEKFMGSGYADDANRSRGDLYVDRSVDKSASDVQLRYTMTTATSGGNGTYGDIWLCGFIVKKNQSNTTTITTSGTSQVVNAEESHFDIPTYFDDKTNNKIDGKTLGDSKTFSCTGDLYTDSNKYIIGQSGTPIRLSMTYGFYSPGNSDGEAGVTSAMDMYVYVVDKGDLRGLIEVIEGKVSSYTTTDFTGAGYGQLTLTATKGANPQSAYFTDTTYNNFVAAYKNAWVQLTDGKSTSQTAINTAFANLRTAYNALERKTATVNCAYYLAGTTNPVPGSEGFATVSPSYPAGSMLTCTAPAIPGYTVAGESVKTNIPAISTTPTVVFYYTPSVYTYTFNPVEAVVGDAKTKNVTYGESYSMLSYAPSFTYNGYTIEGWYFDAAYNNLVPASYTIPAEGNKTLYAKWALAPVALHYNLGATEHSWDDVDYLPGQTLSKPADPDFAGYTFNGWYADKGYNIPFDWTQVVEYPYIGTDANPAYVTEITAYAKFTSFDGKIVFEENGGDDVENIDLSGYTVGQNVALPQPTRLCYTFDGWYTKSDFSGTKYTTSIALTSALKTSGIGLYAKWIPKDITINFNINYNARNASPIDTATNPASITGKADANIVATCKATGQDLPGEMVKYGYTFKGWTWSATGHQTFTTEAAYNNDVNNGYRYDVEEEDAVFQPSVDADDGEITLYPMWVKNTTSAYINLDTYKMIDSVPVPTSDTEIHYGDIVTVRMTAKTNFYTGSSVFVYMYDNTFFELVGEGKDAFRLNKDNDYISAINGTADYSGYTAGTASAVPSGVTYPDNDSTASHYSWIQVSIDPDVAGGKYYPGSSNGKTHILEFKLRVISTDYANADKGTVFMDNAWTRTPTNNGGTMFFGNCSTATTYVWNSKNNVVVPDLTFASSTVTVQQDTSTESTITLNPNQGTWPNGDTDNKTYTGDVGEEILEYVGSPTRVGYTLQGFTATIGGTTQTWVEGYYGSAAQNGATFTAQWKGIDVTNTFYNNDGTDASQDVVSVYADPITMPQNPSYQGYTFLGWATSEDAQAGDAKTDLGTQNALEGAKYYAVWAPATDTKFYVKAMYTNTSGTAVTGTYPDASKASYTDTTGSAFVTTGTTGATVHVVPDSDTHTNTSTDVYVKYSQLPRIVNNNYIFDPAATTNILETTIAPDGSAFVLVAYIGKLVTYSFKANNGSFDVPTPSKDIDTTNQAAYGTGKGPGYEYSGDTFYLYAPYGKSFSTVSSLIPTSLQRTGYSFIGWGREATSTSTATMPINITSDNTYYAVWKGNTISNTFDANNGTFATGTTVTVDSVYGQTIKTPTTNPTRSGYDFKGWATTETATVAETLGTESNASATGDTFYAVWALSDQTYNIDVYYMGVDGTYGTKDAVSSTAKGIGTVSVSETGYAKTGFTFDSANSTLSMTLDESTVGTTKSLVVKYKRNQYKLTVSEGYTGGAVNEYNNIYYGADISDKSYTPTREGYAFDSWSSAFGTMPAENLTITASWNIQSYTLTFNNDGVNYGQPILVEYNSAISAPATSPSKTGWTFLGWNTNKDAETGSTGSLGNMPAKNTTYYAIYKIQSHNAIFMANGSEFTRQSYEYGQTVQAPSPAPTKYGYNFDGWTPALTTMGEADQTYTATWAEKTVTNKFMYNDGTQGFENVDSTFSQNILEPTVNPERAGYDFKGWATSADATAALATLGTQNTEDSETYYAVWAPKTNNCYTVMVHKQDTTGAYDLEKPALNSSYVISDGVATASKVTVDASAYVTEGFTADASKASALVIESIAVDTTGAINVAHVYLTRNSYKFSVTFSGAGEATPKNTEENVYYGATYTAVIPEVTGYTASPASITGTMPAENVSKTVTYTANEYRATFYKNNGTDDVAGWKNVTYLTAITADGITAPERYGYNFLGWNLSETATAAGDLQTMNDVNGISIYAVWEAKTVTNTFDANKGTFTGGKTTADVGSAFDGAVLLPTEPTRAGYTFEGWASSKTAESGNESLGNQTTETAATYFAVWKPENHSYTIKYYKMGTDGQYGDAFETDSAKTADVDSTVTLRSGIEFTVPTGFELDTANSVLSGKVPATGTLELTVKYARKQYKITYMATQGTRTDSNADTYYYEAPVSIAVYERTGYTPTYRWTVGTTVAPETMPAANCTCIIGWTANEYTATFDANDGTFEGGATQQTKQVKYASAVNCADIATPTREGYSFLGWATTKGAETGIKNTATAITTMNSTEGVTVYAVWNINDYQLTVNYSGVTIGDNPAQHTEMVTYSEEYSVISPTVEGFSPDIAVVTGTMPADNVTVNVTYAIDSYTLTVYYFLPDGITPAYQTYTEEYDYQETYEVASPSVTGYTPETETITGTMGTANVEETVLYVVNQYTVTYYAPVVKTDGTLTTVDLAVAETYTLLFTADVDYGTAPQQPTAEEYEVLENYTFASWTPGVPDTMPAENMTFIGSYNRIPVTLDIGSDSTTVINRDVENTNTIDGYIYGVENRLTTTRFQDEYVKVVGDGTVVVTPAFNYRKMGIVGTGTKVELFDDVTGDCVETFYVVIYGDLNGDGVCDSSDVAMMQNEISVIKSKSILDGSAVDYWSVDANNGYAAIKPAAQVAPQMLAADLNGDGKVDLNDLNLIRGVAGWAADIDQTTGNVSYYA